MVKTSDTFEALTLKARKTKDKQDIRNALRFGIENGISSTKIRQFMR